MQEDIIYKLKTLQSIEPDKAWQNEDKRKLMEKISVFGVKNDIFLSARDIYADKARFSFKSLFPNSFAVSFASIALVLTSGILTVGAAQSSLPGDPLYGVKIATEKVALAIASDQDKPKIEIEQAGKRLEELAQISQKSSDAKQHEKVEQLVAEFKDKVDSANTHLTQLNEKGSGVQIASVAKVVNEQSEKYTEVLQKTTASLPETVKEKVAVQVADATKTTERTNIASLLVMVETNENQAEVAEKVQKTVEKAEVRVNELSVQTATAVATQQSVCALQNASEAETAIAGSETTTTENTCVSEDISAENVVITEEARKKLEEAKESLKNSNLTDTLKSVSEVTEIAAQVAPVTATTATTSTEVAPAAATTTENVSETAPKS